jgi:hypothetical protein
VFTGQFGTGNSWNVYESIDTPFTWENVQAFALARANPITGNTTTGHLVTLQSVAENNFVHAQAGGGDRWIGLTDRVGAAPGAMESAFLANSQTDGWAWVTGEPFTFNNWPTDLTEPNNAGDGEDAAHIRGDGLWNDHESGCADNEPVAHIDNNAESQQFFPFIIEWRTNLPTMPPGFPMTRPDPPLPRIFPTPVTRLPGPNGTATQWGTREVYGTGNSGNTRIALDLVLGGTGTNTDGFIDRIDVIDPATNAGTAGTINGPTVDFIGGGGDGFQVVTKGTVRVPAGQGGNHTFFVRSDDGFAMRILSQASGGPLTQHKFTSARTGVVDEDGTLVFLNPTGDSNTLGVVNLPEGTYDVEFLLYENEGGAFYEVSTAKGDFVTGFGGIPRFILLGSGTTRILGGGPFKQAARLSGQATVSNYEFQTDIANVVGNIRTNPTPTATSMVDEAILYDGDDICCGRPGLFLQPSQINEFPNDGNDNFSTAMTGELLVLDTDGAAGETLTFGVFADDNAALHIFGESFTGVGGGGALGNPEGLTDRWLMADFRTGNTNAFGLITLQEGTYDFEAFQLEDTGDSGLELWVAQGNRLADGTNSGAFFPLLAAALPDITIANNLGLGLVAGPGTGPVTPPGVTGDFNGNGTVDAADYVLWRNGNALQNEGGVTPGAATPEDYQAWRANFGRTAPGTAAAGAVPEAATLLLGSITVLFGLVCRRPR